jgi:hypothetical protein
MGEPEWLDGQFRLVATTRNLDLEKFVYPFLSKPGLGVAEVRDSIRHLPIVTLIGYLELKCPDYIVGALFLIGILLHVEPRGDGDVIAFQE